MIAHKKGQIWNKALTPDMLDFEKETGKSAVFRDKITGQFEFWLWQLEKKTTEIIISKKEIIAFIRAHPPNLDTYGYIDGGFTVHEWLAQVVIKKCQNSKDLIDNINTGELDNIINKLKIILAHINYQYDTLSYLITSKIAKIEGKKYESHYQLYEVTHYFKDIQINIGYIKQSEYKSIYLKKFEKLFIEIYKYLKIRCKQITRNDIIHVMTLTRKHFVKRVRYHPYITSNRNDIPYYD